MSDSVDKQQPAIFPAEEELHNLTKEVLRKRNREYQAKYRAKSVSIATTVTPSTLPDNHPIHSLLSELHGMPKKQKSSLLLNMLLVGYECHRYQMANSLGNMIADRTIDDLGGLFVAASKLLKLRGEVEPTPLLNAAQVQSETPSPAIQPEEAVVAVQVNKKDEDDIPGGIPSFKDMGF